MVYSALAAAGASASTHIIVIRFIGTPATQSKADCKRENRDNLRCKRTTAAPLIQSGPAPHELTALHRISNPFFCRTVGEMAGGERSPNTGNPSRRSPHNDCPRECAGTSAL